MNKVAWIILVGIVLIGCAGQPQINERTTVISVGYHSDECAECEVLQAKMRRMNVRFALAPIVFIKYDKTTSETRQESEGRLEAIGMLEIALRDDGLRKVILYDAETREPINTILASDSVKTIRGKIAAALE